ncbi:hypothetical protein FKM82_018109 [Ascaphus truei]
MSLECLSHKPNIIIELHLFHIEHQPPPWCLPMPPLCVYCIYLTYSIYIKQIFIFTPEGWRRCVCVCACVRACACVNAERSPRLPAGSHRRWCLAEDIRGNTCEFQTLQLLFFYFIFICPASA